MSGGKAASAASSSTRSVAKERLSVILASQRGSEMLAGVNMDDLQKDVMEVVQVGFLSCLALVHCYDRSWSSE